MRIPRYFRLARPALVGAALLVAACDLSVSNPGPLADADLNAPSAMPALVTGMSADLSVASHSVARAVSLMSGELRHSGNYANEGWWQLGTVDGTHVDAQWANMHRARWVAETGIDRMKSVLGSDFATSPLAARAYVLAGFANRMLGENVCVAVIDGGPAGDHKLHFARAEQQFTEALKVAQAINNTELINTARAGRASVLAWQGKWSEAVSDAALVPPAFRYDAIMSINTTRERNELAYETINRREYTVFGTQWADMVKDPRVPWDTVKTAAGAFQTGQDGRTRYYRQAKYKTLADNIPLTKGAEMLVLRAEAALRNNDVAGATTLINQQRAAYGLPAVEQPASVVAAWQLLQTERGAVVWLETRRLWDLRRWGADGRNDFLQGRSTCIPVSRNEELSNKNLR
jgi:starch-binding outer membrane protein, SusD/RagB family